MPTSQLPRLALLGILPLLATAQFNIETVAGSSYCGDGGLAVSALLIQPEGVAFDNHGNLYIADANDHRVRLVDSQGLIRTVAGTGSPGYSGDEGPAVAAQLNRPYGLSVDAAGNLFIADLGNARIREVTPDGIIHTLAGGGPVSPVGAVAPVPARRASLMAPRNVFAAPAGVVYFSDFTAQQVYKVSGGLVRAIAGDGTAGYSGDGGPASLAELNYPAGVAADASGNVYVADSSNNAIREISNGVIQTVAQTPGPTGLAVDSFGVPYVAGVNYLGAPSLGIVNAVSANDLTVRAPALVYSTEHVVEELSPFGNLAVVAGSGIGTLFGDGGLALSSRLNNPMGVAADAAGNIYITDTGNNRIREVRTDGVIVTVAGGGNELGYPAAIAADAAGNLYIADTGNNQIEWRAPGGGFSTLLTQVKNPAGVAVDAAGNVYAADRGNGRIVEVTAGGIVRKVASVGEPIALAVDAAGNLFVSDNSQNAVLKIAAGGGVSTAWTGEAGGHTAPAGLAVDAAGNLYLSDTSGNRIVRIAPGGTETVVAGDGNAGFSGDGGPALNAQLSGPAGLAWDAAGNLLIADAGNNRIRRLKPVPVEPPAQEAAAIQVVNAASSLGGPVAPGEIVTIYGQNFDPQSARVQFDSATARIFYAGKTQINALAPSTLTPGAITTVRVSSSGAAPVSAVIPVSSAAPGIFVGASGQAAALDEDGTVNSAQNPAPRGSVVVLYVTGEGQGSSAAALWIGGQQADILFAGPAPGFVGLMQVNTRVPASIPAGAAAVDLIVGGGRSQAGVTISVN